MCLNCHCNFLPRTENCFFSIVNVLNNLYQCNTPFELHDDNYVLKAMKFCERPQGNDEAHNIPADRGESSSMPSIYQPESSSMPSIYQPGITHPSMLSLPLSRTPTSPPLPGILKARVKHEH